MGSNICSDRLHVGSIPELPQEASLITSSALTATSSDIEFDTPGAYSINRGQDRNSPAYASVLSSPARPLEDDLESPLFHRHPKRKERKSDFNSIVSEKPPYHSLIYGTKMSSILRSLFHTDVPYDFREALGASHSRPTITTDMSGASKEDYMAIDNAAGADAG